MSDLIKDVNRILKEVDRHRDDVKQKGTWGEKAVLRICEEIYQKMGGFIYHSYEYAVDKELPGNLKKDENGKLFIENLGNSTEIDVLLVTPFKVFPIEVKTYSVTSGCITLKDDGIYGCRETKKSPVHQNEMHCRHLYSHIFKNLPNGDTNYIVPIVVFVDRCKLKDERSEMQKNYIPATTLDYLEETIEDYNFPLEYLLDLNELDVALKNICMGKEMYIPLRKV